MSKQDLLRELGYTDEFIQAIERHDEKSIASYKLRTTEGWRNVKQFGSSEIIFSTDEHRRQSDFLITT